MAKTKTVELAALDDLKRKAAELEKKGVDIFKSFYTHDIDLGDENCEELVAVVTYGERSLEFKYNPETLSVETSENVLFDENNFPYRESTALGKKLNAYPYYDFDRRHGELYDILVDAWDKGFVPENIKREFLAAYEDVRKAYSEMKSMKERTDALPDNVKKMLENHSRIEMWGSLEDESGLSYRFCDYWKATYEDLYKQKNPRGKYDKELAEMQNKYESKQVEKLEKELRDLGFVKVVVPEEE